MATAYISRTPAGVGDLRKWTFSAWVKRGNLGGSQAIISWFGVSASYTTQLRFDSDNTINFYQYFSGSTARLANNRAFRDLGAWYDIVAVWDTDNATAGDRMKLYVNGVEETVFGTDTNPALNLDSYANSTNEFTIGAKGAAEYFDGEMSHVQFVNSAALAPTEFGEVDSTSGIWKIKTSAYATPGTNGYFLKMEDRTNLDLDSSSNAYTFTTSGTLTATYDNPSNNFATVNPLANYASASTFSNGNNTVTAHSTNHSWNISTMGVNKGKWYWEAKMTAASAPAGGSMIGISGTQQFLSAKEMGNQEYTYGKAQNYTRYLYNNSSTTWGTTWSQNDIIGVALDCDNSKLYMSVNGTWMESGDPTSGSTGTGAISLVDVSTTPQQVWSPSFGDWDSTWSSIWQVNYGNGYFGTTAVTSAEADGAGIGAFEYAPPTGYYAICTKNIKAYGG